MDTIKIVRENIKKYMQLQGITQKELADKLNFTTVYISNLLNGKRGEGLKLDILTKLSIIFDVPLIYLISENIIEEPQDDNYKIVIDWIRKLYLSDDERAKGRFEAEFEAHISDFNFKLNKIQENKREQIA